MNAIQIVAKQLNMQTMLFRNTLRDIDDEGSFIRLSSNVNHLRWIAGHLVTIRYSVAVKLGMRDEPYPHIEKFSIKDAPPPGNRPIDEAVLYPDLKETLGFWDIYSVYLIDAVSKLTEKQFNAEGDFLSPIGGNSVLETFAFVASHEAYHIGQMGFIRKSLGYEPMSYQMNF